jgi:rhodanese-related sulfurtransferase
VCPFSVNLVHDPRAIFEYQGDKGMELISRDELKEKLNRGDEFKLVMALGELAYRAKHIPGSLHTSTPDALLDMVAVDDDIVVYCSNPNCIASQAVYMYLIGKGYKHVRRYAGGLEEWEASGLPLEGEMVGDMGAVKNDG